MKPIKHIFSHHFIIKLAIILDRDLQHNKGLIIAIIMNFIHCIAIISSRAIPMLDFN